MREPVDMGQWVVIECGACTGGGTEWALDGLGRERPEPCVLCDGHGQLRIPEGFLRS